MTEKDDINAGTVEGIVEAEKVEASKLSKTQRQKRRHELSDPSAISSRLSSLLAERFPPEVIANKLNEMLKAVTVLKDGREKPDLRSREAGLKLLLNYSIGLPIQRTETVTVNVDTSMEALQEQVNMSPALKARLIKMTDGA